MKRSNFVSFSHLIKNREKEIAEQPIEQEPEIDYQALYHQLLQEKDQLIANYNSVQTEFREEKKRWEAQNKHQQMILEQCDEGIQNFREELKIHLHSIWKRFFLQLIQNKKFHEIALYDILAQNMSELSDQKNIVVEVPSDFLDIAKDFISSRDGWSVIANQSLELGARFSQEQVYWETALQPVIEQFFEAISVWLEKKE